MGLHERDYGREYGEETPWDRHQREQFRKPKSITIILIAVTCAIWLLDISFARTEKIDGPNGVTANLKFSYFADWFGITNDTLLKPWLWFRLLTYGFIHAIGDIRHVAFNMIGLFFFGRTIEQKLGFKEFLRFYLVGIIAGGIVGAVHSFYAGPGIIGASGAVMATVILFACNYPKAKILLFFVIPIEAWIVAIGFVALNIFGALGASPGSNTAYTVHLAGAAFGAAYFYQKWNFGWLDFGYITNFRQTMSERSRRMKLKIHDPDKKIRDDAEEADRILAKIHQSGEESLTSKERKTLERYSRRQREKRNL